MPIRHSRYCPCLMPGSPWEYSMGWVNARPGMFAPALGSPSGSTIRPKLAFIIIALAV